MVLSAAGGVDHTQLTQLADSYFGSLSSSHEGELPPLCKYVAADVKLLLLLTILLLILDMSLTDSLCYVDTVHGLF